MLGPMDSMGAETGSDAMGAETGSAAEVAGGLDEEAMLIEIKLRNQCKLQQVAWDKRDDCQGISFWLQSSLLGSDQSLSIGRPDRHGSTGSYTERHCYGTGICYGNLYGTDSWYGIRRLLVY